jgi:hypothetical protein
MKTLSRFVSKFNLAEAVYPFGGTSLGANGSMLTKPIPLALGDVLCSAWDRP